MFSPPLYSVLKFPLNYIITHDYNFKLTNEELIHFTVLQGDNMMFRQIRMISMNDDKFQKFVVFVDATGGYNKPKALERLVKHGFKINGETYLFSERSASMVRQSMLSFVERHIAPELDRRISMGLDFSETPTVLSKYYAYRGLNLSSAFCLPEWEPKICIVDDYENTIKDQMVEYLYDKTTEFIDKAGNKRSWTQKDVAVKKADITINCFDGAGICHPEIMRQIERKINTDEHINSCIIRAPYIKGCMHEIDYESFYAERGVTKIKDIWGQEYDVTPGSEPLMILTVSLYKGYKYFKKDGTYKDWERYLEWFRKTKSCFAIAKWNYSAERENLTTKCNYQILQNIDLEFDDFKHFADMSVDFYEKVTSDDIFYTDCFLGLMADDVNPLNHYIAALARNQEMIHEPCVKEYVHSLLDKTRDGFKCGKLWMNATFKFWVPDLVALMEWAGGLPVVGALKAGEIYTFDRRGVALGDRICERNPHISRSEHLLVSAVDNELTQKYFHGLVNCCFTSIYDINAPRLNGSDFDGDLVLVIDEPSMIPGVHTDIPITLDLEDKKTALAETDTLDNKFACTLRGLKSQIGEISNLSTVYQNKVPKTEKTKQEYLKYVSLLSVANGKEIDRAKTGCGYKIPRNIQKYGTGPKSTPYFMKYAGSYYARLHNLSKAHSNMNLLCMSLERWERGVRWHKEPAGSFNWHIMYDSEIGYDQDVFNEIEAIFLDFNKYRKNQLELEKKAKNWKLYRKELEGIMTKEEAKTYETNWQAIYNVYRNKCKLVCPDVRELANILVVLCYEKYPNKFKKFLWHMAGAGVVENIKPVPVQLPVHDPNGKYEYLGQRYSLAEPKIYEARVK